jgi:hypothetical protein
MSEAPLEKPAPTSGRPELPVQVFQQMESLDEDQIVTEAVKDELVEEFVYDIEIQRKHVTSLSYAGVKEAIRRRGKYETLEVHVEEDKDQYKCLVKIRDLIRQVDVLGASTCEKNKPFAYTLAVNKAERNAFRKLIPEKLIAAMVKEFLERRKARNVSMPIAQPAREMLSEKGTSPTAEGPIPSQQSPESTWRVPIIKDQATPDQVKQGLRQYPLLKGTQSYGMLNVLGEEYSIVPEHPVPVNTALIDGFLLRKIVKPLVEKHNLQYETQADKNGLLEGVLIRGHLEEQQVRELVSGARWAFQRATETQ